MSTAPFASLSVTLAVELWPMETLAGCIVTVTVCTGADAGEFTVSLALPYCPSLVAVINTVPTATPVATPFAETVAIALLLLT